MKMKRREFYTKFMAELRDGLAVMQKYGNEIDVLKQKIGSGRYSAEYIKTLEMSIADLKKKLNSEHQQRIRNIKILIKQMNESLDSEIELRGEDITADAKLLQFNLSEKELVSLLFKNAKNATMLKLITMHAKDRGVKLPVVFHWNEEEKAVLEGLEYAADKCLIWYNKPENLFDRVFAPGKQFERVFNVDDTKFQSPTASVSYSDERVANAIRLLNDNKGMSDQTQREIVEEFQGHAGVLTILQVTANKAGQAAAEQRALELIQKAEKGE